MFRYLIAIGLLITTNGCLETVPQPVMPQSASGVEKVNAKVVTGADGMTAEQRNIHRRIEMENVPGSIKHLYIFSAYSGQCLIYSTVDGKPTSSSKRLTPNSIHPMGASTGTGTYLQRGFPVRIGGKTYYTSEVLQDDGTYGSSIPYLYWFDSRGIYHQQYVTGGMIVHVSDQPMSIPNIIVNMEVTGTATDTSTLK